MKNEDQSLNKEKREKSVWQTKFLLSDCVLEISALFTVSFTFAITLMWSVLSQTS